MSYSSICRHHDTGHTHPDIRMAQCQQSAHSLPTTTAELQSALHGNNLWRVEDRGQNHAIQIAPLFGWQKWDVKTGTQTTAGFRKTTAISACTVSQSFWFDNGNYSEKQGICQNGNNGKPWERCVSVWHSDIMGSFTGCHQGGNCAKNQSNHLSQRHTWLHRMMGVCRMSSGLKAAPSGKA